MKFASFGDTTLFKDESNRNHMEHASFGDTTLFKEESTLTTLILKKKVQPSNEKPLIIKDALVTVKLAKKIPGKVELVGLAGTVKEYVSTDDYVVGITAGIVSENTDDNIGNEYPVEAMRKAKSFLEDNNALYVTNEFLAIFNINQLVITDYSLNQETFSNRQVLTINAVSDQDYEIKSSTY
jgi:hypothetical protein